MTAKQTVLVVDPDPDFLDWARSQLAAEDVRVLTAESSEEAFKIFCAENPLVVITEMRLGTHSGLELLARLRKRDANALVVITGALGTTQSVIESMRLGAFDFVRKEQLPFNLKIVVDTALNAATEMRLAKPFEPTLSLEQHQDSIVGQSAAMQEVFKMVGRISNSDAAVMITGESGSGKELVARAIHQYSARHDRPFLAINCAAIPENLLESELFGHEKGSFTGASAQRVGRFEQCDGGTLFLDEIGDMPLSIQSKLLRVLQDGTFSRVGGNQTIQTDVRIVAATNKNLEAEVAEKKFREDLFYRLNVVRLHLPPLRSPGSNFSPGSSRNSPAGPWNPRATTSCARRSFSASPAPPCANASSICAAPSREKRPARLAPKQRLMAAGCHPSPNRPRCALRHVGL